MRVARRLFAVFIWLVGALAGGCSVIFTSLVRNDPPATLLWMAGLVTALACAFAGRAVWRAARADAPSETDE